MYDKNVHVGRFVSLGQQLISIYPSFEYFSQKEKESITRLSTCLLTKYQLLETNKRGLKPQCGEESNAVTKN